MYFSIESMSTTKLTVPSSAKEEMRRLIFKHPTGLSGFKGDLTPTKSFYEPALRTDDAEVDEN